MNVVFYTKDHCPLCEKGFEEVRQVAEEHQLVIEKIDIYSDDALLEKFQLMIPVVYYGEYELGYGQLDANKLDAQLKRIQKEIQLL